MARPPATNKMIRSPERLPGEDVAAYAAGYQSGIEPSINTSCTTSLSQRSNEAKPLSKLLSDVDISRLYV